MLRLFFEQAKSSYVKNDEFKVQFNSMPCANEEGKNALENQTKVLSFTEQEFLSTYN